MPNTDANCTTLAGIVTARLASCYPTAKPQIETALAAIQGLVCWDLQRAYLSAAGSSQLLPGNILTPIIWDTDIVDTNNLHTPPSSDVIIQRKGIYSISATLAYTPIDTTDLFMMSLNADSLILARQSIFAGRIDKVQYVSVACTVLLDVNTVVRVLAQYSNVSDPDQDTLLETGNVFYLEMVQPL